jgi:hypothetical protein
VENILGRRGTVGLKNAVTKGADAQGADSGDRSAEVACPSAADEFIETYRGATVQRDVSATRTGVYSRRVKMELQPLICVGTGPENEMSLALNLQRRGRQLAGRSVFLLRRE